MADIPDFSIKQTFPIASIVEAMQRRATIEQQQRQIDNQSMLQGFDAIRTVGQTMLDRRRSMAQALTLGSQLGMAPQEIAGLEPTQVLDAAKVKAGNIQMGQLMLMLHPELRDNPQFMASFGGATPGATASAPSAMAQPSATPAVSPTPTMDNGAMLTGGLQPSTTTQMAPPPTPAQATPMIPPVNKATAALGTRLFLDTRSVPVMTPEAALAKGSVPKGTILKDSGSDKDAKEQDKMEQKLKDAMNALSRNSRSEYGIEDRKVGQARHLRQLFNRSTDPKTGEINLPPTFFNDVALGMATLASPTATPGVELLDALRQGSLKGDIGKMLTYATGKNWNGSTQDILRMVRDNVDRQGETSEDNRNYIWNSSKDINSVGLAPERYAKYKDKMPGLSYRSMYDQSPDKQMTPNAPQGGTWTDDKEKRYQELLGKHKNGSLRS